MSLTNAQLRALLKAALHNDTTFSDPTDLDTFLTLGQERIVKDSPQTLGLKEGTLSLTTEGSARVYDLASDFYQMGEVFYSTQSLWLEFVPLHEWMETVESQASIPTGVPDLYTIWGFDTSNNVWEIKFNRTPSAAMTYYYWYYWMPPAITASSTSAIAAMGFSDMLLEAAKMYAFQRIAPEEHAIAAANYSGMLARYQAYRPSDPAYSPILRPQGMRRPFSRLGPHYPVDTW